MDKQLILPVNEAEFPQSLDDVRAALALLQEWTLNVIDKIKRGRFLPEWEKKEAIRLLNNHTVILENYANGYLSKDDSEVVCRVAFKLALSHQAQINREMAYFELEPYSLPEPFQSTAKHPSYFRKYYFVRGSGMEPTIPKGAQTHNSIIDPANWKEAKGIVTIIYRQNWRTNRKNILGRVLFATDSYIHLHYDGAPGGVSILFEQIKFMYQITAITLSVK